LNATAGLVRVRLVKRARFILDANGALLAAIWKRIDANDSKIRISA
jgi:hypothetical protein